MKEIIFEFQNKNIPDSFKTDLALKFGNDYDYVTKRVKNLSGIETLLIMVSAQITSNLLIRLIDYLIKKHPKIKIKQIESGKEYSLPEEIEDLKNELDEK